MSESTLKDRIERVRQEIQEACERAGRSPKEVKLVAVSKRFPAERVEEAAHFGLNVFGENYVQEAVKKIDLLRSKGISLEWHLIGHLQKNKVKQAVRYFDWIETIDSIPLLEKVVYQASKIDKTVNCLVQVNISKDLGKAGLHPEELRDFFTQALKRVDPSRVRLMGLMTITKYTPQPEGARPWFKALRLLRDELVGEFGGGLDLPHLSMGMSNDYSVAIEEGATIVRVGQAIFGPRPVQKTK